MLRGGVNGVRYLSGEQSEGCEADTAFGQVSIVDILEAMAAFLAREFLLVQSSFDC